MPASFGNRLAWAGYWIYRAARAAAVVLLAVSLWLATWHFPAFNFAAFALVASLAAIVWLLGRGIAYLLSPLPHARQEIINPPRR